MGWFLKEFLTEAVGEMMLTAVACLTVVGLALAFVWGWERSPLVTGGAGGALLAFLVYGGWELLRPSRPVRGGRLAGVAATTFAVAVVFIAYAWPCTCS
ncbi:hypothetical protein [Streptomyces sp. FL07-04A]|uniref:hypothetical protein n=1 Tax=Streptomyces sp. FL07-04A TaxID=3028658 RepID=UPI0029B6D55E|nr:hypothetical protein [Streptomyces sp. FL07-04A]MDX3578381.1 hypothetical protein [Streptomyces sp. FL07-04A]